MSVKKKVTEGLLAEAAKWDLALTRPCAEAIADQIGLSQALTLRSELPSDEAAADELLAEKRAILQQATDAAIARSRDATLTADLETLLAAVREHGR